MLRWIRRHLPKGARRQYHHLLAFLAAMLFRWPSRKLVVIGVTGTDGKTTTASLIADVLAADGAKVGLSTSAVVQVADRRWLNESHMTMPGRMQLQRLIHQMVEAKCEYAVIEVSSEGLDQYRHAGIDFDVAVITNITPEHIEAHGTFEAYRRAKGKLFSAIIRGGDKRTAGHTVPKVTVVNLDDPSHDYFLKFWAQQHYGTTLTNHSGQTAVGDKLHVIAATHVATSVVGMEFEVDGQAYNLPLPGEYNVRNAIQAIAVARALGIDTPTIIKGLAGAHSIPGRAQSITTRQPWRVVVDYALTPVALEQLYRSLRADNARRIIGVFGAAGGGRDTWKRPILGSVAVKYCDRIILTTDDPYDEDPQTICQQILAGIPEVDRSKVAVQLDRREALREAIAQAQAGDVIAVTGMGSETSMMVKGRQVPWNDAEEIRALLTNPV